MRFKCFLLLTGLALVFGATAGQGQFRPQPGGNPEQALLRQQLRAARRAAMAVPAQPPGGQPGSQPDAQAGAEAEAKAEAEFREMDVNGDGLLAPDEMDDTLRAERDKWDDNHDGFIDLNEFKEYHKARTQKERAGAGGRMGMMPGNWPAPDLPPNLPPWFREYDADHDGQIGLYEWRAAGQPIARFLEMDLNGDGFLTVDEVLWSVGVRPAGD
jgi:hypothetical protein